MKKMKPIQKQSVSDLSIWLQEIGRYWPSGVVLDWLLVQKCFTILNSMIVVLLFIILIGQTIHILNSSEKRYINLKHLLVKWLIFILSLEISSMIYQSASYWYLFECAFKMMVFLLVYPSTTLKSIYLKYFSQNDRNKSEDLGQIAIEATFWTKILISLTLFCLGCSKYMLTFINPVNRKQVQESIKTLSLIIADEKYFWKIYESSSQLSQPPPLLQYKSSMVLDNKKNDGKLESTLSTTKSILKQSSAPKEIIKRVKVAEYISIQAGSNHLLSKSNEDRRFSFFRRIELIYNSETAEITIFSEEDKRSTNYYLTELQIIDDYFLQLLCQDSDSIFIKFNTKMELDSFVDFVKAQ